MAEQIPTERGYEVSDAKLAPLVVLLGGMAALCVAAFVIVAIYFNALQKHARLHEVPPSPLAEDRPLPPQPRLQITTVTDLQQLRAREQDQLSSYGWVDKSQGITRIPIERAMQLVLKGGLAGGPGEPR